MEKATYCLKLRKSIRRKLFMWKLHKAKLQWILTVHCTHDKVITKKKSLSSLIRSFNNLVESTVKKVNDSVLTFEDSLEAGKCLSVKRQYLSFSGNRIFFIFNWKTYSCESVFWDKIGRKQCSKSHQFVGRGRHYINLFFTLLLN